MGEDLIRYERWEDRQKANTDLASLMAEMDQRLPTRTSMLPMQSVPGRMIDDNLTRFMCDVNNIVTDNCESDALITERINEIIAITPKGSQYNNRLAWRKAILKIARIAVARLEKSLEGHETTEE